MRASTSRRAAAWVVILLAGCAEPPVSRAIGARCDDSADCDDRCLRPDDGWPGGFCTLACDTDGDCPGDTRCVDLEGGVCLWTCDDAAACALLGAGWRCLPAPDRDGGEVTACVGG